MGTAPLVFPSQVLVSTLGWLRRNQVCGISAVLLLITVLAGVLAPLIAPYDPARINLDNRLAPPYWLQDSKSNHLLGTDQLGRDLLSRLIHGARISLLVGFVSIAMGGLVGVVLALVAGYFGGRFDSVIMGIVDIQLALPFVILAIGLIAVLGPGLVNLIIVLSISGWVAYCRVVRSTVLSVKEELFVVAAKAIGATDLRIIFQHILPNTVSSIIVLATVQMAQMIMMEAALSFLGLGVQPPTPSWGTIISDGRGYLGRAWWITTLPGIAITMTVLEINFIGDWLRENLDPRLKSLRKL